MEEKPLEREAAAAKLRRSQNREINVEEKLVAVNVYRAMKTKEDVHRATKTEEDFHRATKTEEDQATKTEEAMKAKERKNYFDHLAFMSRLTGK